MPPWIGRRYSALSAVKISSASAVSAAGCPACVGFKLEDGRRLAARKQFIRRFVIDGKVQDRRDARFVRTSVRRRLKPSAVVRPRKSIFKRRCARAFHSYCRRDFIPARPYIKERYVCERSGNDNARGVRRSVPREPFSRLATSIISS